MNNREFYAILWLGMGTVTILSFIEEWVFYPTLFEQYFIDYVVILLLGGFCLLRGYMSIHLAAAKEDI